MFSNQHMVPHLKIHRHLTIHLPRRMSLASPISSWMICTWKYLQGGDQGASDCLNVALHFATNRISGWPGVAVTVLTFSSTLPSEVSDLKFTPVMPRSCKARLLSPSPNSLPPFSPFTPPPAATQVMIVSGVVSEEHASLPASIGYVLTYTLDGETVTDIGKDITLPVDIWSPEK